MADIGREFLRLYSDVFNRFVWVPDEKRSRRASSSEPSSETGGIPVVELEPGSTSFAIFANLRKHILVAKVKKSAKLLNGVNYRSRDGYRDDSLDKRLQSDLPRMVGVGLSQVFDLIKNCSRLCPPLCTKALESLLKILEGLPPQGLQKEPPDLLDDLFIMLRELASYNGDNSGPEYSFGLEGESKALQHLLQRPTLPQDSLSSLACSCLFSLVVAAGSTGKLLLAISDILMSVRVQPRQDIYLPKILTELQRTTFGVFIGKDVLPSWRFTGVPKSSRCSSFFVGRHIGDSDGSDSSPVGEGDQLPSCCVASDGAYLYVYQAEEALLKVGTGYQGTVRGRVYACKPPPFYFTEDAWIGYARNRLFLTHGGGSKNRLSFFDLETLEHDGDIELPEELVVGRSTRGSEVERENFSWVLFADGKTLGFFVGSGKEENITVRTLDADDLDEVCKAATEDPKRKAIASNIGYHDLSLRLVRKCLDVYGTRTAATPSREEAPSVGFLLNGGTALSAVMESGYDDEPMSIASGKDFTLLRTRCGKVLYCGRPQSLGLKGVAAAANDGSNGAVDYSRWNELPVSQDGRPARIIDIAVGHEAEHGLLLGDDGRVFFVGTAKRGEDGDSARVRREPKATKPKVVERMSHKPLVSCASNYGSCAYVTRAGDVNIFGKDASAHCDKETGQVVGLRHTKIVSVAMGKAHVAAISAEGSLYTFGMNNRGQCGRRQSSPLASGGSTRADHPANARGRQRIEDNEPSSPQHDAELDVGAAAFPTSRAHSNRSSKEHRKLRMRKSSRRHCAVALAAHGRVNVEPAQKPRSDEEEGEVDDAVDSELDEFVLEAEIDVEDRLIDVDRAPCFNGLVPHTWKQDAASICRICGECSQFGMHCPKRGLPGRVRGWPCGCGPGEAGCSICGICRTCHYERVYHGREAPDVDDPPLALPAADFDPAINGAYVIPRPSNYSSAQERLARNMPVPRRRERESAPRGSNASDAQKLADASASKCKVSTLPPSRVTLPSGARVKAVACGLYHTVVLMEDGVVFTFGNNTHGQLGNGGTSSRDYPARISFLPTCHPVSDPDQAEGNAESTRPAHSSQVNIKQITAGKSFSAFLDSAGHVFVCGLPKDSIHPTETNAMPGLGVRTINGAAYLTYPSPIPNLGGDSGRKAVWIGASGDQLYVKLDETLINPRTLQTASIVANRDIIALLLTNPSLSNNRRGSNSAPSDAHTLISNDFGFLAISRADGSCHSGLRNPSHVDFTDAAACLDPLYDVMWRYDKRTGLVEGYNTILTGVSGEEVRSKSHEVPASVAMPSRLRAEHVPLLLTPEFMIPVTIADEKEQRLVSRSQAALALLASLDTLAWTVASARQILPNPDGANKPRYEGKDVLLQATSVGGGRGSSSARSFSASERSSNGIMSEPPGSPSKALRTNILKRRDEESRDYSLPMVPSKPANRMGLSVVSRFDKCAGGWGYSSNSVEAVRFMCDNELRLYGVGLYGGRGPYNIKVKLLELGYDGGDHEGEGNVVAETDEMVVENEYRQSFQVFFEEPAAVYAQKWYVIWARISGPASCHGIGGQNVVVGDDGAIFHFKFSYKANNGTEVASGQIPELYYRSRRNDLHSGARGLGKVEPVIPISEDIVFSLSPECFSALISLLSWSWETFKDGSMDLMSTPQEPRLAQDCRTSPTTSSPNDSSPTSSSSSSTPSSFPSSYFVVRQGETFARAAAIQDLQRLAYIACSCLRLLRVYVNYIFPVHGTKPRTRRRFADEPWAASCTYDARLAVEKILSDPVSNTYSTIPQFSSAASGSMKQNHVLSNKKPHHSLCGTILEESHATFSACFHAFYPSNELKWDLLCNVLGLHHPREEAPYRSEELLRAVFRSLTMPSVRLGCVFPVGGPGSATAAAIETPGCGATTPGDPRVEANAGPGAMPHNLVDFMDQKSFSHRVRGWDLPAALDKVVGIVCGPVHRNLESTSSRAGVGGLKWRDAESGLVTDAGALLSTLLSQLSNFNMSSALASTVSNQEVLSTPSRFTRVSQARMWNTCNGAPDAIGFTVDRPGIAIAGAGVFGSGALMDYELELLVEKSAAGEEDVKPNEMPQRWVCLETASGTYRKCDIVNGQTEIRFSRPVPIKERARYVLRLRHYGGYSHSGEAGVSVVKGPDGACFSFFTVSVSFNGTSLARGQIPHVLYYSLPKQNSSSMDTAQQIEEEWKQSAMWISMTTVQAASDLFERCIALPSEDFLVGRRVLAESHLVSSLLPVVFSLLENQIHRDPKVCVETLDTVKSLLPFITELNLEYLRDFSAQHHLRGGIGGALSSLALTTSTHYAVVESKHPYEPAAVQLYRVTFPSCVQWITLEFDPACCLGQIEDTLQLFIPVEAADAGNAVENRAASSTSDCPGGPVPVEILPNEARPPDGFISVLPKFNLQNSGDWPRSSFVLPGNKVIFSLSSASPYLEDDKTANFYGFKCLVVGHDYSPSNHSDVPCGGQPGSDALWHDGLLALEREVVYLAGLCCADLVHKQLNLRTSNASPDGVAELASAGLPNLAQFSILSKGLALDHSPTIREVLEDRLALDVKSNEFKFLMDFVKCTGTLSSSGGRLARWLQPEPFVEPRLCQVIYSRQDMHCGRPASITIITRDQYGQVAQSTGMQVEVQAMPLTDESAFVEAARSRIGRDRNSFILDNQGMDVPDFSQPYRPTIKDKLVFHSISVMKAFEVWSFEELRHLRPPDPKPVETMYVKNLKDGSHVATWIPGAASCYAIQVFVDGYLLEGNYTVEVHEPPAGQQVPNSAQLAAKNASMDSASGIKSRKFSVMYSAGLRVRTHPSLQSEQIGVIKQGSIITIAEELQNKDGMWVRLTFESLRVHCSPDVPEGWALQYNQHYGKSLLLPVAPPLSVTPEPEEVAAAVQHVSEVKTNGECSLEKNLGLFQLASCGASGHNIRCEPNLRAAPIGIIVKSHLVTVVEELVNEDGTWFRLDPESAEPLKFSSGDQGEAWSLAANVEGTNFLLHADVEKDLAEKAVSNKEKDRQAASRAAGASPRSSPGPKPALLPKPSSVKRAGRPGTPSKRSKESSPSVSEDLSKSSVETMSMTPSCSRGARCESTFNSTGSSVRLRMSKASGSSLRSPPPTPKRGVGEFSRSSRSSSPTNGRKRPRDFGLGRRAGSMSRDDSSKWDEKRRGKNARDSGTRSLEQSTSLSASGALQESIPRCGSTESDTSAMVSSLTKDPSKSASGSSLLTRSGDESPMSTPSTPMMEIGPQIPTSLSRPVSSCGDSTGKSVSPARRKARSHSPSLQIGALSLPVKRIVGHNSRSPSPSSGSSCCSPHPSALEEHPNPASAVNGDPCPQAMKPSVAEALRAVFAAFIWHEGVVHDAMACASYLKFHPSLTKSSRGAAKSTHGPLTSGVRRRVQPPGAPSREEKARFRHSIEVTSALRRAGIETFDNESEDELLMRLASHWNANKKVSPDEAAPAANAPGLLEPPEMPATLQNLAAVWDRLVSATSKVVAKQNIPPGPVLVPASSSSMNVPTISKNGRFFVCALCSARAASLMQHMQKTHPGCGRHTADRVYFTEGELAVKPAGVCGEKGSGIACPQLPPDHGSGEEWYQLCQSCRAGYFLMNQAKHGMVANTLPSPLSQSIGSESHRVMMRNAVFLLRLHSASESTGRGYRGGSRQSCTNGAGSFPIAAGYNSAIVFGEELEGHEDGWMYDLVQNKEEAREAPVERPFVTMRKKRSVPSTSPVLQRKRINSTGEAFGSGYVSMLNAPSKNLQNVVDSLDQPRFGGSVVSFVSHVHDLELLTAAMKHSISKAACRVYGMQAFEWLLRTVTQPSCVHDLLWCLVNGFSVPCGPETTHAAPPPLPTSAPDSPVIEIRRNKPGGGFSARREALDNYQPPRYPGDQNGEDDMQEEYDIRLSEAERFLHELRYAYPAADRPPFGPDGRPHRDVNFPNQHAGRRRPIEAQVAETYVSNVEEVEKGRQQGRTMEHPLADLSLVGLSCNPQPLEAFHKLMQTVADLMPMLPAQAFELQTMAVRCWGFKFLPSDQVFLHRSRVFNHISRILSGSEDCLPLRHGDDDVNEIAAVTQLADLTSDCVVTPASRPNMASNMVDGSTETFWESGDEDRTRCRHITVELRRRNDFGRAVVPHLLAVHIDNVRDLNSKTKVVSFKSGPSISELTTGKTEELPNRFAGWVTLWVKDWRHTVFRIGLRGPDNTVRVRQIRLLGEFVGHERQNNSHRGFEPVSAVAVKQSICEAETLRVFRQLVAQVFDDLLADQQFTSMTMSEELLDGFHHDGPTKDRNRRLRAIKPDDVQEEADDEEHSDLKEHMVGILFSRESLSDVQKQVVEHIVQGIGVETCKLREKSFLQEEEAKMADDYCFELMSMLMALSGSRVGQSCLAKKGGFLVDILCLLHLGSARVQRQVVLLLKRLLPSIDPKFLARTLNVASLPPLDYRASYVTAAESDSSKMPGFCLGILDGLLSCIAKGLQVRLRVRRGDSKEGGSKMSKADIVDMNCSESVSSTSRAGELHADALDRSHGTVNAWFRGRSTPEVAKAIIQLLKNLSMGSGAGCWKEVTKAAIAEKICHLANMTSVADDLETAACSSPTIWLALAALCVLSPDHVEKLTWSGKAQQAVEGEHGPTFCENHDDGVTQAIVQCHDCGQHLCADCDKILHLPQRMRGHERQVFGDDKEGVKVDLHEGCGRVKLSSITALADPATLQAMIEFRPPATPAMAMDMAMEGSTNALCRFCSLPAKNVPHISNTAFDVCDDAECQMHAENSCTKTLTCGHRCNGVKDESTCLPCLNPNCVKKLNAAIKTEENGDQLLKQDGDDMCMVCFSDSLSCAPVIRLEGCRHLFHYHCCRRALEARWPGPRISFGFTSCPICKTKMDHPALNDLLEPIRSLYDDVKRKALMRLRYEGLDKCETITTPGSRFYLDPAGYAMDRYAYYVCFKCDKAYFGGEARCEAAAVVVGSSNGGATPESYDPKELVCGGCSDVSMAQMCPKHCTDYLEYKCRYCCSVAVFFCFGTTHFCNACHSDFQRITNVPKEDLPRCPVGPGSVQLEGDECPLHTQHPPTGEEFALGCGVCRKANTF